MKTLITILTFGLFSLVPVPASASTVCSGISEGVTSNTSTLQKTVTYTGTSGNDVIQVDASNWTEAKYTFIVYALDGNDTVCVTGGNTKLNLYFYLDGGNGDDVLKGHKHYPNLIIGGFGSDILHGGNKNDDLLGHLMQNSGDFTTEGGNDTVLGFDGNDYLTASGGNDSLQGGSGDDEIWGGSGTNTMKGGNGSDLLHGLYGTNIMWGNGGKDFFLLYKSPLLIKNTIKDFNKKQDSKIEGKEV